MGVLDIFILQSFRKNVMHSSLCSNCHVKEFQKLNAAMIKCWRTYCNIWEWGVSYELHVFVLAMDLQVHCMKNQNCIIRHFFKEKDETGHQFF